MSNQTVEILIIGSLDAQVSSADVVDGLVVDHEAAIRVFKGGVGCKDRIVWLNDSCGDLRSRVNAELELALLAIVDGQAFHEESSKTRASSATERVEDQEALETRAIICNMANLVENLIDEFFANRIMTTGVVVGGIFLASNHLFGMEETAVGASADFVNHIWLQITIDGAGNIFAVAYNVP